MKFLDLIVEDEVHLELQHSLELVLVAQYQPEYQSGNGTADLNVLDR